MATDKTAVLQMVRRMPADATFDQILFQIELKAQMNESEQAIARGYVVSHDEAVKRHLAWRKKRKLKLA